MTLRSQRNGYVSVAVLVGLILLGLVAAALLKVGVVHREQLRTEAFALQADWLIEAGLERAAARLDADPTFDGETWEIPAEKLSGRPGVVRITILESNPSSRTVRVEAEYPSEGDRRIKRSKRIHITSGRDQNQEGDEA